MENFEQALLNVESDLKSFRLQRYLELPDIDLYMEQVISYVNRHLEIFNRSGELVITPSMINNYVKYGIIPPPDKKKYKRRHIAYIYAVYFLKQVLTMSEIRDIIRHQVKSSGERTAYEFFCNELERALKSCCRFKEGEESVSTIDNYALKYSAIAIANKLYAQRVIELQREPEEPEEESVEERKAEKKAEKAEKAAKKLEKVEEKKPSTKTQKKTKG